MLQGTSLSGKARYYNWHNLFGFWCLLPLFVIALSGVVISYKWADNLLYRIVGENPPPPRGNRTSPPVGAVVPQRESFRDVHRALNPTPKDYMPLNGIDELWNIAETHAPGYKRISMRMPKSADQRITFTLDFGDGGQPHKRSDLILDRKTGEILGREDFSNLTLGRQLRAFLRFAHTGEVAGIAGQTIAGIASVGTVILVWTGFALIWRRLSTRS